MVELQYHGAGLTAPPRRRWRFRLTEAELLMLENCLGHALGAQDNAMEPLASDDERAFIEKVLAEFDNARAHGMLKAPEGGDDDPAH